MRADGSRRRRTTFLAPAAIAAASCFGLVASLVGDGVWDWLGTTALLVPVLACAGRPSGRSGGRSDARRPR